VKPSCRHEKEKRVIKCPLQTREGGKMLCRDIEIKQNNGGIMKEYETSKGFSKKSSRLSKNARD